MLEQLSVQAPQIRASSYYIARDEVVKELASGQLDFAIDVPLANDPNLCRQPLSSESYVCAVRDAHPLVNKKITMKQYLALDHLHVSSRRSGAGHVDVALSKSGLQRNIAVRVQHHMVAPRIIRYTDLAWTVPRALAQHLKLKTVELPFELSTLDWFLYWHKSADNDQANRWLRQLLTEIKFNM
ncbi:LysR substrate-binding domain-containing protein [Oceanicoccus sp. KOV_DT_Chl]|uniref:LysR substrate-binding domain-containing protein n=1 Tax=Oceanicoccus sp. KOV_DT_Chl TaxID=1904639 RepID=UPI001F41C2A5|nr:LysR substrate-binding domain-containing protein [Oceanicoccus sp. KOV_DT_Chl]